MPFSPNINYLMEIDTGFLKFLGKLNPKIFPNEIAIEIENSQKNQNKFVTDMNRLIKK